MSQFFLTSEKNTAAYLAVSGWDKNSGEFEVWRKKFVGEVPSANEYTAIPTPSKVLALQQINSKTNNGVTTIDFHYGGEYDDGSPDGYERGREIKAYVCEVPIVRHPDFNKMFAWYGEAIVKNRVIWKRYDPGPPKNKDGSASCPNLAPSGENTNPMRGVEFYFAVRYEYTIINARASRMAMKNTFENVGWRDNPPYMGDPVVPNWITHGTKIDKGKSFWLNAGGRIFSNGSGYQLERKWLYPCRVFIEAGRQSMYDNATPDTAKGKGIL